ncbi:hypothetical protein [Yokenella regensburgei]|jgi:hypothetical protein|uniref:Uncharacterized protein n=1 Tax=Yokenella regensburgei TaxID=158877 RepID=A0AB38G395_9ENTR|nr:hypothetical protein [Yokenella regensburgei]KAF1370237.1 hypothetical protein FHR25_001166 [Yokenella regensburgei]MDQ4430440.1 hypothetical protein [Yokenella regensburgei]QIU87858.1 hypothetical protein HEC60_13745 [Yokenella regensburgei]RKR54435.1 hypothetical protein C7387_2595 [Yokenella regensburgei]SQA65518.1 Uncharacterised protein [Yokenella regensburgei]
MLSTEKWDNWENYTLLVPFTALTCDENRIFTQNVPNLLAQSVDKNDAARSFINQRIAHVMIITLRAKNGKLMPVS